MFVRISVIIGSIYILLDTIKKIYFIDINDTDYLNKMES